MQKRKQFTAISALILALVCVLSLLPVTAYAVGGSTGDLKWELNGSTLEIKGSGAMPNYTDANMAPWYSMADSVKTVVIKSGVQTIGDLAFYGCVNLTSISVPDSIVSIGNRSFKGCASLSRITLPAGVTGIGEACFEECEKLSAIFLPEGLKNIDDYAFFRCAALKTVSIPASVEKLGMIVFAYCGELTSVTINCPITKVPDWTFYGCKKLMSLTLPASTEVAGSNSFHDCRSLINIYYSGGSAEELMDSIRSDSTALADGASIKETGKGDYVQDDGGSDDPMEEVKTVTSVVETENTTVIRETEIKSTFTKDGTSISREEAENEIANGNAPEISSKTTDNLYASIGSSDGWTDLAKITQGIRENNGENSALNANIQLNDSKLKGDDLGKLAGTGTVLEITTDKGCHWRIDTAGMTEKDVAGKEFDLSYTVSKEKKSKKGIESNEIYKLIMEDVIGGETKIAVNLPGSSDGSYATLYQRKWFHYEACETVLIDANGDAWFDVSAIPSGGTYYIGINAKGVDADKATIPHTMLANQNFGSDLTLTDADGNVYAVGERESSWGITGKRFSTYVFVGLGAVVLVVTIVMISINTVKKSRRRAAEAFGASTPAEETEEEMRLRIMKEMLSKIKKNKP